MAASWGCIYLGKVKTLNDPDLYESIFCRLNMLWLLCHSVSLYMIHGFDRVFGVACCLANPFSDFLRVKLVDVTLPLNLTRFLRNETAYLPWESTIRNFQYFVLMFDRTEVFGPMQACVIKTPHLTCAIQNLDKIYCFSCYWLNWSVSGWRRWIFEVNYCQNVNRCAVRISHYWICLKFWHKVVCFYRFTSVNRLGSSTTSSATTHTTHKSQRITPYGKEIWVLLIPQVISS